MSNRPKFTAAILAFFLLSASHFPGFSVMSSPKMPASKTSRSPYLKRGFRKRPESSLFPGLSGKTGHLTHPRYPWHNTSQQWKSLCPVPGICKKLKKFSQSKLSTSNRLTLDLLLLYYHTEASLGDNYLWKSRLAQASGSGAAACTAGGILLLHQSGHHRLPESALQHKRIFPEHSRLWTDKIWCRIFMCDETLERIQDQCRAFIQNPDSNYMLEIFPRN